MKIMASFKLNQYIFLTSSHFAECLWSSLASSQAWAPLNNFAWFEQFFYFLVWLQIQTTEINTEYFGIMDCLRVQSPAAFPRWAPQHTGQATWQTQHHLVNKKHFSPSTESTLNWSACLDMFYHRFNGPENLALHLVYPFPSLVLLSLQWAKG